MQTKLAQYDCELRNSQTVSDRCCQPYTVCLSFHMWETTLNWAIIVTCCKKAKILMLSIWLRHTSKLHMPMSFIHCIDRWLYTLQRITTSIGQFCTATGWSSSLTLIGCVVDALLEQMCNLSTSFTCSSILGSSPRYLCLYLGLYTYWFCIPMYQRSLNARS